jgi:hypothetical protein
LASRAVERKQLRLNHPGLGALNFEALLELVSEEVIGWNMRDHVRTEDIGLFGECEGVAAAMEEQGRQTVHVHFSIWIKGFSKLRSQLFFGNELERAMSARLLPQYFEHISSTALIASSRNMSFVRAFDHENCPSTIGRRNDSISVVGNQQLRNLRHRLAYKQDNTFAMCKHCPQGFTYEDMVGLYCQRVGGIDQSDKAFGQFMQGSVSVPKTKMHALCIQFQKAKGADTKETPILAINACYNSHSSSHPNGCFKCQQKRKRKHICSASHECECRYRMPDLPRKKACVRHVKENVPWFAWDGTEKQQPLIEILPKRNNYDLFQNVSCKVISESKLTCNSNVSIITDGPVGQYQFKYIMKSLLQNKS